MIKVIQKQDTYPLRHELLRPHCPFEDIVYETDLDSETFHLGFYEEGLLVSVASFNKEALNSENAYRLRAMATLPDYRRRGYGKRLIRQGIRILSKKGIEFLWCKGRVNVQGYYEALGFHAHGPVFDYPTIGPHIIMKRPIRLELEFKQAILSDIALISKYRLQSHFNHAVNGLSFDVNAHYGRLNNRFNQYPDLQFMITLDDRVCGFVGLEIRKDHEDYGYIHFIYLEEFYQNQGYGQKMLAYASDLIKSRGLNEVKLRVKSNNHQALKAYKKQGFYLEVEEDHQYLLSKKL